MTDAAGSLSWRQPLVTALLLFVITAVGCCAAFAIWLNDLHAPQIVILGSGSQLSVLAVDGPARLVLATGDDANGFENALASVRPIFARRVDVLLLAGSGDSLLVPLAAYRDPHARLAASIGPLARLAETDDLQEPAEQPEDRVYTLGPSLRVTVETRYLFAADPAVDPPVWRVTIERGQTCVVVISDGAAASRFSPTCLASAIVVSGDDPTDAWSLASAPVLIANAEAISGPDLRSAAANVKDAPAWVFRVSSGEALRLRFVPGGIEIPSESASALE